MEYCKPITTPMQTSCKLRKDDDSKSTDQRKYKSMIGILLYVTTSRPDVMQAVGQVAQFQARTKGITCLSSKEHFQISQRNIRFWIMVSKRKGSITYFLHRCRLGRLH
jgi:hypothetical protein